MTHKGNNKWQSDKMKKLKFDQNDKYFKTELFLFKEY